MSNVIVARDHKDWLNARRGGIGSSEVATILGVNPWDTPYKLWLRKTGRVEEKEDETFLMKAGHYLEDAVSRFYADETGVNIVKSSASEFVVVDKEKDYMRVSPDRYAYLAGAKRTNANKIIVECKTTQLPIDVDSIPKHWFVQLMYQLSVCRIDNGALAWLTQGREFGYKNIAYDADFAKWIREEVERFWVDNIVGDKEPALSDVSDVILRYPRHTEGKSVEATMEIFEAYKELSDVKAQIKRLDAIKTAAEDKIKMAMGDAEILQITEANGIPKTLATWKTGKDRTDFDKTRFATENKALYDNYLITKPGSRTFLIK